MMHDMMGPMMWGMGLIGVLLVIVLVLAILALGKYLFRRAMRVVLLALWFLVGIVPLGAAERPANFILHAEPRPVPELRFVDGEGRSRTLADFEGKVVLLNVWATWCPPCRKEMPALDHLQSKLGGSAFEVVALSIDRAGAEPVRRFYAETGVKHLTIYLDTSGKALRALGAVGLPITLLIDREGREVGRLVGPAVWDTPEMVAFLKERIGPRSDEVRL